MRKRTNIDRRQYPRIEKKLPIKIIANGYDFFTRTKNISCVGAYCHVDKYIPPFTKIMVKLVLPIISNDTNCDVECKGVVVRTEDENEGGFNIAIFFSDIKEGQQKKIVKYINQFLPKEPSRPKRL